jgi:hypothetical protein
MSASPMTAPDFRDEDTGPADGCTGAPWCPCWDCERVDGPAPLLYAEDYGIEAPF